MNAQDLLHKCPFCGSTANIWLKENRLSVFVECDNMDCRARSGEYTDIHDVVAKWNARHIDIKEDINERLKRSGKRCDQTQRPVR